MAKILLLGYGYMGKLVEQVAIRRGHQIASIVNREHAIQAVDWSEVDVAIDFSIPSIAESLVTTSLKAGVPTVSGTTSWPVAQVKASVRENDLVAFLHATNFSLGVNAVFLANEVIAKALGKTSDYRVAIEETHHTRKLDTPSGTAVTLANRCIEGFRQYERWVLNGKSNVSSSELQVNSIRKGEVIGDHVVRYASAIDEIELTHHAKNREGFALGAVLAAEYLIGKKGNFSMRDVLGFS